MATFLQIPGNGIVNLDHVTLIEDKKNEKAGVIFHLADGETMIVNFDKETFPFRSAQQFHDDFLCTVLKPVSHESQPKPRGEDDVKPRPIRD